MRLNIVLFLSKCFLFLDSFLQGYPIVVNEQWRCHSYDFFTSTISVNDCKLKILLLPNVAKDQRPRP